MLDLSIIEQAMKDVMAQQVKDRKWPWIREIKTYGGEFDDDITAIIKAFPAIWVTFDGSKTPEKTSANKTKMPVTFVVLVGNRSVRNEEAQRHGAGADIGTFQMLNNVQQLLTGNDLSSQGVNGLAHLELGRVKTIFNTSTRGQSLSVLAQEFTTSYTITASDRIREEAKEEAWLERVNINYHFDPKDYGFIESDLVELRK
ncbi:phage protein Gp37 [Acinetobacter sp.]|uniref:phage protein Gp37 n=1 Tax=Acinetobacter sp. TaxID=472 RepID=UPI003D00E83E